jgi:hypothetical protein
MSANLQDLILSDYETIYSSLYENPESIKYLLLELSIFRTFVTKQNLLADFKEFEHTFTIENNIDKGNT